MAKYIERIDAIKAVNKQNAFTMTRVALIDSLNSIPAADVAPVVHGRWRYCGFLQECQACGEIYSVHGGNSGKSWNFCPNCGAKMDGGAENG